MAADGGAGSVMGTHGAFGSFVVLMETGVPRLLPRRIGLAVSPERELQELSTEAWRPRIPSRRVMARAAAAAAADGAGKRVRACVRAGVRAWARAYLGPEGREHGRARRRATAAATRVESAGGGAGVGGDGRDKRSRQTRGRAQWLLSGSVEGATG
jgi:hypothetical protein